MNEEREPLIKPAIQALIDRGNITKEETEHLRANSYEWEAMVPAMTDEAFIHQLGFALQNCGWIKRPAITYNDAVVTKYTPELLTRYSRLKAKLGDYEAKITKLRAALRKCDPTADDGAL